MAGHDTNLGAKRARQTREALGLDPAAPLDCVLSLVESDLGLPVVVAALPAGVAGCCWRDGDDFVLWVNGTQAPVRQRFTLAHELGHVRCGHDGAMPVETFVTLGGKTTDSREVQANAFAAELLAPAAGVAAMVNGREPALEDVVRIAAAFGISTIAGAYRLNTLRLTASEQHLVAAIEDGRDEAVWERLSPTAIGDAIATISVGELPRLSPALRDSALAGLVRGLTSIRVVAESMGCDEGSLSSGAASIGI